MNEFFVNIPRIIEESAKSTIGVFVLMILILAFIAFFYFYRSSEWIRGTIFIISPYAVEKNLITV